MRRGNKTRRRPSRPARSGWWTSAGAARLRGLVRPLAIVLACGAVLFAGSVALGRLDAHVKRALLRDRPDSSLSFVDLPERLVILAQGDLDDAVAPLLDGAWTDDRLCRAMAQRLATVGWVAKVRSVHRTSDGHFAVSCRYREPVAMVAHQGDWLLIDAEGARLPGTYRYDGTWRVIQGVAGPAPKPGLIWPGADLQAGLRLLAALAAEPFASQLAGVDVSNYDGRTDPRASRIELLSNQPGGRIRWGSPPGMELEENSVSQKLAILRENFRRTGRADAGHLVIDVSTFPDRFTVPG
ncbi:MAG: hypothetical protein HY763_00165 [Planctomycetes bacterium]|nr:hypothetical protein [Planctomycetota bacterium]